MFESFKLKSKHISFCCEKYFIKSFFLSFFEEFTEQKKRKAIPIGCKYFHGELLLCILMLKVQYWKKGYETQAKPKVKPKVRFEFEFGVGVGTWYFGI